MKRIWKRLSTDWSWADTVIGFFLGWFVGMAMTMYLRGMHGATMKLLSSWSNEIVSLLLIFLLIGRIIKIAQKPRSKPLDYNKITIPGVIAANFLTIIMGTMLIIITVALVAPGVLELIAKGIQ